MDYIYILGFFFNLYNYLSLSVTLIKSEFSDHHLNLVHTNYTFIERRLKDMTHDSCKRNFELH